MTAHPFISVAQRRARLAHRHGLVGGLADTAATAQALVALHATEATTVHLTVQARTGQTLSEIDDDLYRRRLVVKQLAMRRTVFTFPVELLPAVWASAAARVASQQVAQLARDLEKGGLTDDGIGWIEQRRAEILGVLAGDGPQTTARLRERLPALAERLWLGPATSAYSVEVPVASRLMTALAADGSIVRGENDGGWRSSRPFWLLRDRWIEPVEPAEPVEPVAAMTPREGYRELVRRWLWSYGPGTEADLVWWLGATKAAVRAALADLEAVPVETEDGPGFLLPDDLDEVPDPGPWAALLPALDPTTMGWKGRSHYLPSTSAEIFDRNGNGGPSAWWCGRVVGGWRQLDDGTVIVIPTEKLPREATTALGAEAERLTGWFGGEVIKPVYQSPLARAHAAQVGGG